jgi:DNA-binding MarR family transcriptional regulator
MSESTITNPDTEYQALRVIDDLQGEHRQAGTVPSQRDFARALNMSVGMTNAIIKRLVGKGWLVMHRINGRNLSYALTPEGTREVAKRSYRYLRRTIGNVVRWKDAIDHAVMEARESGCERVLLVGDSDLDFIVEHAASRHGMVFVQSIASEHGQRAADRQKTMLLYSEKFTEAVEDDALLLQDIIVKLKTDTGKTV